MVQKSTGKIGDCEADSNLEEWMWSEEAQINLKHLYLAKSKVKVLFISAACTRMR